MAERGVRGGGGVVGGGVDGGAELVGLVEDGVGDGEVGNGFCGGGEGAEVVARLDGAFQGEGAFDVVEFRHGMGGEIGMAFV